MVGFDKVMCLRGENKTDSFSGEGLAGGLNSLTYCTIITVSLKLIHISHIHVQCYLRVEQLANIQQYAMNGPLCALFPPIIMRGL